MKLPEDMKLYVDDLMTASARPSLVEAIVRYCAKVCEDHAREYGAIKDLELNAFDLGVETNKGRVLLSGFVDDRHQAQRAVQLASAVRGVERVENALKLK